MGGTRPAKHADGLWYTNDGKELQDQLARWLAAVNPPAEQGFTPPINGCRAIIAPHAGYSYSGPAAAWAYKSIDTTDIERVFILGPSHNVYLNRCDLSGCDDYATPLGNLKIDVETINKLVETTSKFGKMSMKTDRDEHSIEMHLPYLRHIFRDREIKLVPILVGAINKEKEVEYGELLAEYLGKPENFFVISSDFCHWGTRFDYTLYYPEPLPSDVDAVRLRSYGPSPQNLSKRPIHTSISDLDHEAMDILTLPPRSPTSSPAAEEAHTKFSVYLNRTKNTICGRHPIGVLLGALAYLEKSSGVKTKMEWVRYEQSSKCQYIRDSSVSYASAYITFL
ncbi:MEMO1 family [Phlebopus sp. FC_14]|nr:MEMO1 family [Phlebopus sp. FC_14]